MILCRSSDCLEGEIGFKLFIDSFSFNLINASSSEDDDEAGEATAVECEMCLPVVDCVLIGEHWREVEDHLSHRPISFILV